jgi:hypothetical protein
MKMWKKVVLFNAGWLLGIGLSLFVVPRQTPLWLWATLSSITLAFLDFVFFGRQNSRELSNNGRFFSVVGCLGLVIFFLDILYRYLHR